MSDHPQYPSYPGPDRGDELGGSPQPGPLPGYGQASPPPPGYGYPAPPTSTNVKAVLSLVFGIISLVFCWLGLLFAVAAIVLSVLARKEIGAQRPGAAQGTGMATAGLVTGIIGTVIQGALVALTILGMTVD